jgi:hypothetical protein
MATQRMFAVRAEPAVETIVRPFETLQGWPATRRAPPEQDQGEAYIEWSAKMPASVMSLDALIGNGGTIAEMEYESPDSETSEDPLENDFQEYSESGRVVQVVRVTNPEDPSNYVDVERIDRIFFNGPAGKVLVRYNNRPRGIIL